MGQKIPFRNQKLGKIVHRQIGRTDHQVQPRFKNQPREKPKERRDKH